jgi:predicted nucleic acid-binding protein
MTPVVVDTDVVSFLFKDDSRGRLYLPYMENRDCLISFMTQAELEQWALLAKWNEKRRAWMQLFLERFVVVASSHDLVVKWAEVMVAGRRAGRRIETADAWVAATAMLYDGPLITNNRNDYLGIPGLKLISES